MILIVSKERLEPSTEDVMDWLAHYNANFGRFNGDALYQKDGVLIEIGNRAEHGLLGNMAPHDGEKIDIRSAWFRRWSDEEVKDRVAEYDLPLSQHNSIMSVMKADQAVLRDYFFSMFNVGNWLTPPGKAVVSKLDILRKARQCGLNIPDSIICTQKSDLLRFKKNHGRIITKDLSIAYHFYQNDTRSGSYTFEVDDEAAALIPDQFIPSFFQRLIEKKFEIRAFYLEGTFYSMAIFSQADKQTSTDFRNYTKKGNRTVPYKLPAPVEDKLRALMEISGLNTGSIDIIKSIDDEYIFLEVNPVGQIGMTSVPCNYHLEKLIAEYLIKYDSA